MYCYLVINDDIITGAHHSSSELENNPGNYVKVREFSPELMGKRLISVNEELEPLVEDVTQPVVPEDPRCWWIDVGPFYDRFGADALAIAASDHGACRAVQTLTGVRKYIDLKDPRIGQMIDMLIAVQQPAAQAFAPGSGPMTAAKKAAILDTPTAERERHVKGLVQDA
ncbi:hypothetical protein [Acidovorax sp. BLS4]|uniref:hypothetical protein n=1 Tax=Acidovorax sp. BLS4 TaxID=3273430 RepID=UPI002943D67C|nr:hypothetical protein [Paracidovorax avenae]WOI43792.1 hypothetical protein R1Z03_14730 [Paracidovorax avenae]